MVSKLRAVAACSLMGIVYACGPATATVCDPGAQTTVLDVRLANWTPSPAFTISAKTTLWIKVTVLPYTYYGLFGDVGPVADLHTMHAGAVAAIVVDSKGYKDSMDPLIELPQGDKFNQISIPPGTWQVYANSDPGILLVSCPSG